MLFSIGQIKKNSYQSTQIIMSVGKQLIFLLPVHNTMINSAIGTLTAKKKHIQQKAGTKLARKKRVRRSRTQVCTINK